MTDLSPLLVFGVGVTAGIINTVAGGGSLLTIPLLVEAGLGASVANATNRVAVLMQSATTTARFAQTGALQARSALRLVPASLVGVLLGAYAATRLDDGQFRMALALIFAVMGCVLLKQILRPADAKAETDEVPSGPRAQVAMLAVGFYGGFIQAGVGVLILGVLHLAGGLRLLHANALKAFLVLVWTVCALVVFAASGLVDWTAGLVLGAGGAVGGVIGVSVATRVNGRWLKVCLAVGVWVAAARFAGLLG